MCDRQTACRLSAHTQKSHTHSLWHYDSHIYIHCEENWVKGRLVEWQALFCTHTHTHTHMLHTPMYTKHAWTRRTSTYTVIRFYMNILMKLESLSHCKAHTLVAFLFSLYHFSIFGSCSFCSMRSVLCDALIKLLLMINLHGTRFRWCMK